MSNAARFILPVPIAAGRLRVARKRGPATAVQEVDLAVAQIADQMRSTFSTDQPLTPDHRDMLLALVHDLYTETWENTTDDVHEKYLASFETSIQFDELTKSFERFASSDEV